MRPCNKLPAVQCRIGHKCTSAYCQNENLHLTGRGRRPDDPRSLRSQNPLSSVAQKRCLREPSLLEKVPRNEADEVSWHKLTKSLSSRRGGRACGRRGVRDTSLTLGSLREGAPRSGGGDCGTNEKDVLRMRHINPSARALPHPRSSGAPSEGSL